MFEHDSIAIFRRREGGTPTWQEEEYLREYTEEAVSKLKDLGVTLVIIPFYKGFGLEAEREYLQGSRKLASLLRKYGIRVGVYVGSTIAYETFLLEKPEARDSVWKRPSLPRCVGVVGEAGAADDAWADLGGSGAAMETSNKREPQKEVQLINVDT